jgi:hypothetical protein
MHANAATATVTRIAVRVFPLRRIGVHSSSVARPLGSTIVRGRCGPRVAVRDAPR